MLQLLSPPEAGQGVVPAVHSLAVLPDTPRLVVVAPEQ
jgi:hypothetical protein